MQEVTLARRPSRARASLELVVLLARVRRELLIEARLQVATESAVTHCAQRSTYRTHRTVSVASSKALMALCGRPEWNSLPCAHDVEERMHTRWSRSRQR